MVGTSDNQWMARPVNHQTANMLQHGWVMEGVGQKDVKQHLLAEGTFFSL
jgi:hypothetical protein